MHNLDTARIELGHEMENFEFSDHEAVFTESEQMELASELLEVASEEELENFLGDLISKAGHAVGSFVSSPTGQALGGFLKGAAKQLLPTAGQALGGYLGGAQGAQIGGQLATQASNLFEYEGEAEDKEWEAANTLVKLAGDAVRNAASSPAGMHPRMVASNAITEAAKVHAPELLNTGKQAGNGKAQGGTGNGHHASGGGGGAQSGRWMRRGNHIVVIGA